MSLSMSGAFLVLWLVLGALCFGFQLRTVLLVFLFAAFVALALVIAFSSFFNMALQLVTCGFKCCSAKPSSLLAGGCREFVGPSLEGKRPACGLALLTNMQHPELSKSKKAN